MKQKSRNNQKEPVNYSKEKEDVEKTAVPTSTGKKNQPRNDFPVALVTSPKRMSVEGFQIASSPCGSSPQKHPKIDSGTPPGHMFTRRHHRNEIARICWITLISHFSVHLPTIVVFASLAPNESSLWKVRRAKLPSSCNDSPLLKTVKPSLWMIWLKWRSTKTWNDLKTT